MTTALDNEENMLAKRKLTLTVTIPTYLLCFASLSTPVIAL